MAWKTWRMFFFLSSRKTTIVKFLSFLDSNFSSTFPSTCLPCIHSQLSPFRSFHSIYLILRPLNCGGLRRWMCLMYCKAFKGASRSFHIVFSRCLFMIDCLLSTAINIIHWLGDWRGEESKSGREGVGNLRFFGEFRSGEEFFSQGFQLDFEVDGYTLDSTNIINMYPFILNI